MPKKVVILASGNGTNTANICRFFHRDNKVAIISVFTNNPLARVIERVKEYGIKAEVFDKQLQPLHTALFIESNPSPVKYAASLLGMCMPQVRLPLVEIKEDTKKKVSQALKVAKLL